jgi:integrase
MSAAFVSKGAKTYKVRVSLPDKRSAVLSCGTTDEKTASEIHAFVTRMKARRRWDVLEAAVLKRVPLPKLYDADVLGMLDRVVAESQDVDLDPLVTEWAKKANAKYVKQVRAFIPDGRRFPRSKFRRSELSRFLAELTVAGPTKNRYRAALSVFGRWLVEREVLDFNPVRDVRGFKEHDPRDKWLNWADVTRLIRYTPFGYKKLLALLYGAGIEIGAALKLTYSDISYDAQTVHVHGSKTKWRNRVVRLEPWAWAFIPERGMAGGLLFPGVTYDMAYDAHRAALEAAGLTGYTMHDARHSYAVNALRRGLSPQVVAHQLGHRDATMVLKCYGRFIPTAEDYQPQASTQKRKRSGP